MMLFLALFLVGTSSQLVSSKDAFVLLGGTGDLAKKYIWDAVFHEFFLNSWSGQFFTAGRRPAQTGLAQFIQNSIKCSDSEVEEAGQFAGSVQYVQLASSEDYAKFCQSSIADSEKVIYYLSIPPSAFKSVLDSIRMFCNLSQAEVILEKPFGLSYGQVRDLLDLTKNYKEKSIHFVDHYLAKRAVMEILPLRNSNPTLLNLENVKEIEIAVQEKDSISIDRLNFYDQYGVVLDVILSHISVILLRLISGFVCDKTRSCSILESAEFPALSWKKGNFVVGQHVNYQTLKPESKTPTLASFLFHFHEIPVTLWSGKYLDRKLAFARLVFENDKQFVFVVNPDPQLVWHRNLEPFVVPETWERTVISQSLCESLEISQECCEHFVARPISVDGGAYRLLLQEIFKEDAVNFLSANEIEITWKFWDKILTEVSQVEPFSYETNEEALFLRNIPSQRVRVEL